MVLVTRLGRGLANPSHASDDDDTRDISIYHTREFVHASARTAGTMAAAVVIVTIVPAVRAMVLSF